MAAFRNDFPVLDPSGSLLDRVLRTLRSLRPLARCARFTMVKNSMLEASWDLLETFSCGFVLFLAVSMKLQKILQNRPPSFQNHAQNYPKSPRKPPKITPKTLQKRGLEGIALRIGVGHLFCRIWGRLDD